MIIYQVDSFTGEAFRGNPAGVAILADRKSDEWMQSVAKEMNLSETAFLYKNESLYDLRWFTPAVEVDLCGHATLAGAHVLWEMGYLNRTETAHFSTRSGELRARFIDGWIELDFPLREVTRTTLPEEVRRALNVDIVFAGMCGDEFLVEVESEEVVKKVDPDFGLLSRIASGGIMVTAPSSRYDFVSRFFAPHVGINEDPVTGSAHCALGPYWREKLKKDEMIACQVSARGGIVKVRVGHERVMLLGQAVTVFRAEFFW